MNPGDTVQTDDEWLDFARMNGQTTYHVIGTCKMGNDPMAVVDDELRVHGIAGLRVVDASIMPTLVSGNTNAAVIMIAEKGADMIKAAASRAWRRHEPVIGRPSRPSMTCANGCRRCSCKDGLSEPHQLAGRAPSTSSSRITVRPRTITPIGQPVMSIPAKGVQPQGRQSTTLRCGDGAACPLA